MPVDPPDGVHPSHSDNHDASHSHSHSHSDNGRVNSRAYRDNNGGTITVAATIVSTSPSHLALRLAKRSCWRRVSLAFFIVLCFLLHHRIRSSSSLLSLSSLSSTQSPRSRSRSRSHPPLCRSPALLHLGRDGTWIQDWDHARRHGNYPNGRVVPAKKGRAERLTHGRFRPSEEAPFPWPTSWRWAARTDRGNGNGNATDATAEWESESESESEFYPLRVTTAEEMCHLLASKLNVRKIAFYGDSLTMSQYESFLNLMGTSFVTSSFSENPSSLPSRSSIACPTKDENASSSSSSSSITIPIFMQKDTGGSYRPQDPRTEYYFSEELRSFLRDDDRDNHRHNTNNHRNDTPPRTLAIFNIGAHYHNTTWYHQDMRILLHSLQRIGRTDDLYFFRTNVPGHRHCHPLDDKFFDWDRGTRDRPYDDIEEFMAFLSSEGAIFDWEKFPMWNEYSAEWIERFNARDSPWSPWKYGERGHGDDNDNDDDDNDYPVVHLLDVFPMTALRRDGHRAIDGDCLHYVNPGPVDWWNRLWMAYLEELSDVLEAQKVKNCVPKEYLHWK